MQKSPNNLFSQFVIIGNPENRRVTGFCEAVRQFGHDEPLVLPYLDWLTQETRPSIPYKSIVKIDSPGENNTVRQLFTGNTAVLEEISRTSAWYTGFCNLLDKIHTQTAASHAILLNDPPTIQRMFDKPGCHAWLQQLKIPVPRTIQATGYEHLLQQMNAAHMQKVFIKPAHASSASGLIAFRKMGKHLQAITTIKARDSQLYNSLKVQTYTNEAHIAPLVDRILHENAIIEEWLPKATLDSRYFDIRVLVIDKRARHIVLRTSQNIITNLHLGNRRGDMQLFLKEFGEDRLQEVKQLAERTAACFPYSLYMGIDILLTPGGRECYVLEVNAFGDLLPGLIDEGENCYEAEINAIIKKLNARAQRP